MQDAIRIFITAAEQCTLAERTQVGMSDVRELRGECGEGGGVRILMAALSDSAVSVSFCVALAASSLTLMSSIGYKKSKSISYSSAIILCRDLSAAVGPMALTALTQLVGTAHKKLLAKKTEARTQTQAKAQMRVDEVMETGTGTKMGIEMEIATEQTPPRSPPLPLSSTHHLSSVQVEVQDQALKSSVRRQSNSTESVPGIESVPAMESDTEIFLAEQMQSIRGENIHSFIYFLLHSVTDSSLSL